MCSELTLHSSRWKQKEEASALRELLFREPDKVYFLVRYLAVEGRCGSLLTVPCCLCSTTCRRCCCRFFASPAGKSCLPGFNDRVQASSLRKLCLWRVTFVQYFCLCLWIFLCLNEKCTKLDAPFAMLLDLQGFLPQSGVLVF